jgi:hypothetical protein
MTNTREMLRTSVELSTYGQVDTEMNLIQLL